jgi:MoaA/NifB/PqqE/SkfB family radical SAM enzyme
MMNARETLTQVATRRSYLPFVRAGAAVLRARLGGRVFPWFVHFHVTGRCNLSCPYCYARYEAQQLPRTDPPLPQVKAAIDELAALGTRYLSIQGGEPLLRKDLGAIVDHALARKLLVGIVTNGVFIHRQLEVLLRVHSVKISLDGAARDHDAIRGAGTYQRIRENLELARRAGLRRPSFDATVSTHTLASWEHVVRLAAELGGSVFVAEISPAAGERLAAADLGPDQRRRVWRRARQLKRQGLPIENSDEALDNMLAHADHIDPFEVYDGRRAIPRPLREFAATHRCPYGSYAVFLDCNGVFYACPRYFGVRGYETGGGRLGDAYRALSRDNRCQLCRTLLNCQVGYLFSSARSATLLQMGRVAARYAFSRRHAP